MNERHRTVSVWLADVFGEDNVPRYEIDEHTLEVLNELRVRNEEQNKIHSNMLSNYLQKSEEYRVEQTRLSRVLAKMQLSEDALGPAGIQYLQTLSQAALILETADTATTNLLLALSTVAQRRLELRERCRAEQKLCTQLLTNTKSALQQNARLAKAYKSLEEQAALQAPDLHKKCKQAGFLANKSREYKRQIESLRLDLTHGQADSSIYHSSLLKMSEDLAKLKEELKPIKAKLDSYHQLPPDLGLATVKVEEARREVKLLEEELSKHLNMMHL